MKNIAPNPSSEPSSDRTDNQPNAFFLAVALTAILYFNVGSTLPNSNGSLSRIAPQSAKFSESVAKAVLQDLSSRSQLPAATLRIVRAEPYTWPDDCLGLRDTDGFCIQTQVPGWQVIVANGPQRWVYRTNATGSVIKLHEGVFAPRSLKEVVGLLPQLPQNK